MIRGATILQSGPLSYTEHGQVSRPLSPPLRLDNLEHFHFLSFRDNAYPRVTRRWWHSRYHGARFSLPSTPKIDHDGISRAAPEAPAAPSEAIASGASRPVFFFNPRRESSTASKKLLYRCVEETTDDPRYTQIVYARIRARVSARNVNHEN